MSNILEVCLDFPKCCLWERESYFDHAILFLELSIKTFCELAKVIELFESRVDDGALWYDLEVHKKVRKLYKTLDETMGLW